MSEFIPNDGELTLSLEGQAVGSIANNLTTTDEGYALDARQGKVLDTKKLDVAKVANNLTTIENGWALDARQGKWLDENKVGYSDIANDLNTDDVTKVLSAAQGMVLSEKVTAVENAIDELPEIPEVTPESIGAVTMKTAQVTLFADYWSDWSGEDWQYASVSGVTEDNTVVVAPVYQSAVHYNECGVVCGRQSEGGLSFIATIQPPSEDLTVNVLILT